VNEHSLPMNDLRWLNETGRMHLIKYEHRAQSGKWLRDAIRADESDAEDSAPEHLEDTSTEDTETRPSRLFNDQSSTFGMTSSSPTS
jgi:hypothetical protein